MSKLVCELMLSLVQGDVLNKKDGLGPGHGHLVLRRTATREGIANGHNDAESHPQDVPATEDDAPCVR
jgi:hypothetical protein